MAVGTHHHFVIEPLKGVGPIRFGMHKDEVSRAFTYVYQSFFKGESKVRSDHCQVVGLIIHYDDASRVDYIEIVPPRYTKVTLELFGKDITGISVRGLAEFMRSRSVRMVKYYYGYDFPEIAMNTYNDQSESEDDPIEVLGIGLLSEKGLAEAGKNEAP